DVAEAARLDPSLAEERSNLEYGRAHFQQMSDLEWLAQALRRTREKHAAATAPERKRMLYRRARELSDILIRENCTRADDWRAQFDSVDADTVRLRVPSGDDFAISLVAREGEPEILEIARTFQRGACVVFSGRLEPRELGHTEQETLNAPGFALDLEQIEACPELTARRH